MHLIYDTAHGKIVQSDNENCYYFHFKGNSYRLPVCAMIAFKTKLDAIKIEDLLLSDAKGSDLEIIPLCNKEHLLVLTLDEIIELKDLFAGSLVLLELNSIVHQRITRALV